MSDIVKDILTVLGIIVGSFVLAFVARWIIRNPLKNIYSKTKSDLDDIVVKAIEKPIMLAIIAVGLYAGALTLLYMNAFDMKDVLVADYIDKTHRMFQLVSIMIVCFGGLSIFNRIVGWRAVAMDPGGKLNQIKILRKFVNITAWFLIAALILTNLGYKISTLLATLGVAGLAVALALQETLANVFAGFYLLGDRSVSVGDYVKLDSGEEGFIEEVSWRNTRIRLWQNNMVIVPNSKLIQSVITNYNLPFQELSVYVSCGVSYKSDLQQVEDVTLDVARKILREVEGSVKEFEPVIRFKEFGDSNINFLVVLRAQDIGSMYMMHHEFIKALHKRYREEGIEISYPVRVIVKD